MKSTEDTPILVTGAAGAIGAIGRNLTTMLLAKGRKVRALVRRLVVNNVTVDCKTAIQTNNVEIDDRGLIYIVDRAGSGMHILQLTGSAKALVGQNN